LLNEYEERFPEYYHSPAVDGQFLQKTVWQIINDGELSAIPFIIGSNADEWYDSTPKDVDEDDVVQAVKSSNHLDTHEALAAVKSETDYREAIERILTADSMLCPSQYLAATQSALNNNAWVYYFTRLRDGEAGAQVRAYHGAELPYVFGTHDPWITTNAVDWQLSDQMIAYWTQFASMGDPNADGVPDWPFFGAPNYQVMNFANVPTRTAAPEHILCRVFRESIDEI
jgi:para-nitrobenzyl esterase